MASKKLLVADDSLTIQKVIRLALSNEGYEIHAASDGNDASQQIAVLHPDVVLIDVSLPEKSAFEVKTTINQHADLSDIRFILMSSAFEKVDEELVAATKFDGRLTKPFDPANLRQIISEVLSKEDLMKPVQPAAAPIITQPDAPPLNDLWEKSEDTPPPAPLSNILEKFIDTTPSTPPQTSDSDIKELTESTIRMSGLDDFQWTINEGAKKEQPLQTPTPQIPHEAGEKTLTNILESEPVLKPPPSFFELSESNFPIEENTKEEQPMPTSPPPFTSNETNVVPLSTSQMEELLQKQLQETLEKMAQKILPEVAERVIKQEIHKLLSQ